MSKLLKLNSFQVHDLLLTYIQQFAITWRTFSKIFSFFITFNFWVVSSCTSMVFSCTL